MKKLFAEAYKTLSKQFQTMRSVVMFVTAACALFLNIAAGHFTSPANAHKGKCKRKNITARSAKVRFFYCSVCKFVTFLSFIDLKKPSLK